MHFQRQKFIFLVVTLLTEITTKDISRATFYRDRVRLENVAQGWKNGPLDILSIDSPWYAKNRDISLRF